MKYLVAILLLTSCNVNHRFSPGSCILNYSQEFVETNEYEVKKVVKIGNINYQLRKYFGSMEEERAKYVDINYHQVQCPERLE